MLFNSISYIFFFPIVVFIYFCLPQPKYRIPFLLLASYFFYMCWNPVYLLLILLSTIIDYVVSRNIPNASGSKKNGLLGISLFINLGLLAYFKYYNFLASNIQAVVDRFNPEILVPEHCWLLPVGISFYTFQTLGYTIDVYRGNIKAERNFFTFALYVSYFPQLVAGPIERASNLIPQLKIFRKFDYQLASDGMKLILWGLFMKIVVADRLAVYVDSVYNKVGEVTWSGPTLILATVFFSFQIYCDFSAYSNIAIGSSKALGITLMDNFKGPYMSRNISEFWRRWHISLSTWFRDYLYIPLGGSRGSEIKKLRNIFAIFLVSGVWHGANWTFVMWGLIHAIAYLVYTVITRNQKKDADKKKSGIIVFFQILATYVITTLAWIFFRANSLSDAFLVYKSIFSFGEYNLSHINPLGSNFVFEFRLSLAIFVFAAFVHSIEYKGDIVKFLEDKSFLFRMVIYVFLIFGLIYLGNFYNSSQFVYFQF